MVGQGYHLTQPIRVPNGVSALSGWSDGANIILYRKSAVSEKILSG